MSHRDFKPHDVLIDPSGRVRVTDFGLAFAEAQVAPTAAPMDQARAPHPGGDPDGDAPVHGAPEQLEGRADAKSDQYSFCLSLLEALGGEVERPLVLARGCPVSGALVASDR